MAVELYVLSQKESMLYDFSYSSLESHVHEAIRP